MGASSTKATSEIVNEAVTSVLVKKSSSVTQRVSQTTVFDLCTDLVVDGKGSSVTIGNELEWDLEALVEQLTDVNVAKEISQEIEQKSTTKSDKLVRLFEFDSTENNNKIVNIIHNELKDIQVSDIEQGVNQSVVFRSCTESGDSTGGKILVTNGGELTISNAAEGISRAEVLQGSIQRISDQLDNYADQEGFTETKSTFFAFLGAGVMIFAVIIGVLALWYGICKLTTSGATTPSECDVFGCLSAFKSSQCKGMDAAGSLLK